MLESQGDVEEVRGLQEVNLNESTEEFWSAERALTYADLYAMLGNAG
jgi:DNA/RNA endonuclease YhcR with UshA esterase domain